MGLGQNSDHCTWVPKACLPIPEEPQISLENSVVFPPGSRQCLGPGGFHRECEISIHLHPSGALANSPCPQNTCNAFTIFDLPLENNNSGLTILFFSKRSSFLGWKEGAGGDNGTCGTPQKPQQISIQSALAFHSPSRTQLGKKVTVPTSFQCACLLFRAGASPDV